MYQHVVGTIGHTPLIHLQGLTAPNQGQVYVKIEKNNPSGSIKDRAAWGMVQAAVEAGELTPGGTVIEPTSGNTGISLAMIGASQGYSVILVMPETMSLERRQLIQSYGAEIILTPGKEGMAGAVQKAQALTQKHENYWMPNQFENPANREAHYQTTGPEIYEALPEVTHFVAGVGTGGTISGVSRYLKEQNPEIQVCAIEPEESRVLAGHPAGSHKIQGIGANFVPEVYQAELVDQILSVASEEAQKFANVLAKEFGLLVGVSSGANVQAATTLAQYLSKEANIVTVLPDTGERYLSTGLFRGQTHD